MNLVAYENFMAHRSPECNCHDTGPGWLKSSVKDWGDRSVGDVCPKGLELWEIVRITAMIKLTEHGECVTLYPQMAPGAWEKSTLSMSFGLHHICNGWMQSTEVARDYQALFCRQCSLRVVVPLSIKTISDLRAWSRATFNWV